MEMVGISYNSGTVLCEQYHGRLDGTKFAALIREHFPNAFLRCQNKSTRVLQDGCPVQNSAKAKLAFKEIEAELYQIPTRNPDVNVIENLFSMVERLSCEDAIQQVITRESYEEFSARVKKTIKSIWHDYINRTIESLNKRIDDIAKSKGQRIKY